MVENAPPKRILDAIIIAQLYAVNWRLGSRISRVRSVDLLGKERALIRSGCPS